jgi:hypothetical protein
VPTKRKLLSTVESALENQRVKFDIELASALERQRREFDTELASALEKQKAEIVASFEGRMGTTNTPGTPAGEEAQEPEPKPTPKPRSKAKQ